MRIKLWKCLLACYNLIVLQINKQSRLTQTDGSVAANLRQTAAPTTTEHQIILNYYV